MRHADLSAHELHVPDLLRGVDGHHDAQRGADRVGAEAGQVVAQTLGQHGNGAGGQVAGQSPASGFLVEHVLRRDEVGYVGQMNPDTPAALGKRLDGKGIVDLARGSVVDVEGGQVREINAVAGGLEGCNRFGGGQHLGRKGGFDAGQQRERIDGSVKAARAQQDFQGGFAGGHAPVAGHLGQHLGGFGALFLAQVGFERVQQRSRYFGQVVGLGVEQLFELLPQRPAFGLAFPAAAFGCLQGFHLLGRAGGERQAPAGEVQRIGQQRPQQRRLLQRPGLAEVEPGQGFQVERLAFLAGDLPEQGQVNLRLQRVDLSLQRAHCFGQRFGRSSAFVANGDATGRQPDAAAGGRQRLHGAVARLQHQRELRPVAFQIFDKCTRFHALRAGEFIKIGDSGCILTDLP